ncbi:hypothetical protein GCM10027167_58990 [Nocardia heshunensis]
MSDLLSLLLSLLPQPATSTSAAATAPIAPTLPTKRIPAPVRLIRIAARIATPRRTYTARRVRTGSQGRNQAARTSSAYWALALRCAVV